jgi:hypothetical protein
LLISFFFPLKEAAVKAKYKDFFRGSIPADDQQQEMDEEDEDLEEGDEEMEDEEELDDDDEPREKRVK